MYEFSIDTSSKPDLYRDLLAALDALTASEPDPVANMANAAALIWEYLPALNWAGFYRARAWAFSGQSGLHQDLSGKGRLRDCGKHIEDPARCRCSCVSRAYHV